jgi:small subunit ribosomal protein S4
VDGAIHRAASPENYGLREEQLRRLVRLAKRGKSPNWIDKLCGILERRLDNAGFRARLVPSVASGRQLVRHGKVLVDGKPVTIPSFILKPGQ